MERATWSESRTEHVQLAEAASFAPAVQPSLAAEKSPPRFAVGGHLFGRHRTVFAAVPIACVRPNPHQPRQHFDESSLADLAASIRERGLLQPIIVRRGQDGEYTLVAGERRLRAAEIAGVALVPAILSQDDLLEVALEENVQREDLSPLEEAEALATLAAERGHSHAELAQVIHKSRPYVSNTLALTRLPDDVKREVHRNGAIVSREVLINIARQESAEAMRALWNRAKLQALSVRAVREEISGKRRNSAADLAIRACRRVGRALRALPQSSEHDGADWVQLRRSLERLHRQIGRILSALPEAPDSAREVSEADAPPRAAVNGGG